MATAERRQPARRAQTPKEGDDNARRWMIGGTVAVGVGLVAFALIRKWVKERRGTRQSAQAASDLVAQTRKEAQADASKAQTITDAEAQMIADSLYSMMEGFGTYDSDILKLFGKMRSKGDWAIVSAKFGTREYGTCGSPLWSWMPSTPTNLYGWLVNECSTSTMTKIDSLLSQWGVTA